MPPDARDSRLGLTNAEVSDSTVTSPAFVVQTPSSRLVSPASPGQAGTPVSPGEDKPTVADDHVMTPPRMPPPGTFGKYVHRRILGRGGMGVVYLAHDPDLGRDVALKTIRADEMGENDSLARFWKEAQAAAKSKHPNIVAVYDIIRRHDYSYFVMEYVSGGSLADHKSRFKDNPRRAAEFMAKVARAVHHAHENKVIHRDLKPGNILIDEAGEPHVADFGLAKLLDSAQEITQKGEFLGTWAYMSPEQAAGDTDNISAASDVWALGVILYELLTGRRPFREPELEKKIRFEELERPRAIKPELDPALEAICLKCLQKEAGKRFQTAAAMAGALEALLQKTRTPQLSGKRFIRRIAMVAVVGLATALIAFVSTKFVPHANEADRDKPENKRISVDQEAKIIQNELSHGESVSLLDPTGFPRCFDLKGLPTSTDVRAAGTELSISRPDRESFVEFLREPICKDYRVEAEVRHDSVAVDGSGGLVDGSVGFVLMSTGRMTAGGPETCILALTFADVGPLANQKRAEWRHASALRLALWRIFEDSNLRSVSATVHELGIDPIPGAWRRVTVDISTDALTVALDGTPAFQKKREDILREAKSRLLYAVKPVQFPKDAPGLPNLENLNLGSRELFLVESLGALVSQGSGSFRNVSVTPRSNP